MFNSKKMYVIVVGCGFLGSYIANRLSRHGHSVVVIDRNESAFDSLTVDFSGFHIEGDATEFITTKQAKCEKADLLIAATDNDNINLMIAQIAKKVYSVPRVLARVNDPKREEIYQNLGIKTICPASIAGEIFIDMVI